MASQQFRVCKGASIMLSKAGGRIIVAGHVVEADKEITFPDGKKFRGLTKKQVEQHLASGYLEKLNNTPVSATDLTEHVPGSTKPLTTRSNEDTGPGIVTQSSNADTIQQASVSKKAAAAATKQITSPWIVDPEGLAGKSVDELNVMVIERDETIAPFETPEEAIAQLSQDFDKAKKDGLIVNQGKVDPKKISQVSGK